MSTSAITAQSASTSGIGLSSYQPISLSSSNALSSMPLLTTTSSFLSGSNIASASCNNSSANADFNRIVSSNLRSTHEQMKNCISIDLTACQREVNFLRMIDRKAPLLYEKNVVENAIRRYETCWLPMQVS